LKAHLDVQEKFKDVTLTPPGKIVHLHRAPIVVKPERKLRRRVKPSNINDNAVEHDRLRKPEYAYQATWSDAQSFAEIALSGSLLSDHQPNHVADVIQHVAATTFDLHAPYYIPTTRSM
jgi:hypothetical protein